MKTESLFLAWFLLSGTFSSEVPTELVAAEGTQNSVKQIIAHRGASAERPECTLSAFERAIQVGATAVEMDVRTSRDGKLFLLHDSTLDRTTDGTGNASEKTLAQLRLLDAGTWFDEKYRDERIPELREALLQCRARIDVLLDLKEQGDDYARQVVAEISEFGDPQRTIVGVRSVQQARLFRKLLPQARQLGLIPDPEAIGAFVEAGVETIRLWPKWLTDDSGVRQIAGLGAQLHLNGTTGLPQEILPLLLNQPFSLSADDPARLIATLKSRAQHQVALSGLDQLLKTTPGPTVVPWFSAVETATFLNRDYKMLKLPPGLQDAPRIMFSGGDGGRIQWTFKKPAVVFAALGYNDTGNWTFPDGHRPEDLGWQLLHQSGYRGTSNPEKNGKPHFAAVYYCQYQAKQKLTDMPAWWLCLGIMSPTAAVNVPGFKPGISGPVRVTRSFSYEKWSTRPHQLKTTEFQTKQQWSQWQAEQRRTFRKQLVFPYDGEITVSASGDQQDRGSYLQQEYHVYQDDQQLFRFFHLNPAAGNEHPLATIVCFMGHGKVAQILDEVGSYQHACARQFAQRGYQVFAMENVGMEPWGDRHHELDRLLRLDGYSWYSLLFAHQQILLDHVFAARQTDVQRVGVAGVSTGGLLALSAAAMDSRVAATSVQGIFGSMRVSFIKDRNRHCACGAIPGLLPEFDLPEMALLVTPRRLHVSNAQNDGFSPAEAERCLRLITPHFQRAGGQQPEFSVPPGSHEFAFPAALKFFENSLGKP